MASKHFVAPQRWARILVTTIMTAGLYACGGGGAEAPVPVEPVPVVPVPVEPVPVVPVPVEPVPVVPVPVVPVPVAPIISAQPLSQTVVEGRAVSFEVVAQGDAPLVYQWRRDGADVPGANASVYTLAAVQRSDNQSSFSVVVRNAAGQSTSQVVTLTVNLPAHALNFVAGGSTSRYGAPYPPLSVDGPASQARFSDLQDMVVSPQGTVYTLENGLLRQVTSAGDASSLAGRRFALGEATYVNGPGTQARFYAAQGLALDALGNIYVADTGNKAIRKVTPSGVVSTIAGAPDREGYADGPVAQATFTHPMAVAVDASGAVYVLDVGKKAIALDQTFFDTYVVRKISPNGVVSTVPGGTIAPPATIRQQANFSVGDTFSGDGRLVLDREGNLFVAATQWPRYSSGFPVLLDPSASYIQKITPAGVSTILAGSNVLDSVGAIDGVGTAARFFQFFSLTVDSAGVLHVVDYAQGGSYIVRVLRRIDRDGEVSTPVVQYSTRRAQPPDGIEFTLNLGGTHYNRLFPNFASAGPGGALFMGVGGWNSFNQIAGSILVRTTKN